MCFIAIKMNNLVLMFLWAFLGLSVARPGMDGNQRKLIIGDETARFFEDQINKTIQCFKKQLAASGYPDLGIPSLDPLRFNRIVPVDIKEEYLKINVELNNLVIDGLVDFDTVSINLSHSLELETHFHFPRIHTSAYYIGDLNILGLYAFYGEGDLDIEFLDVVIKPTTQYQMTPPLFGDYSVVVNLGKTKFQITGLLGDEELSKLFSIFASSAITTVVNLFHKQVTAAVSPIVLEKFNSELGHLPFLDYLAMITNLSCDAA